jgi:hypothetical protein
VNNTYRNLSRIMADSSPASSHYHEYSQLKKQRSPA